MSSEWKTTHNMFSRCVSSIEFQQGETIKLTNKQILKSSPGPHYSSIVTLLIYLTSIYLLPLLIFENSRQRAIVTNHLYHINSNKTGRYGDKICYHFRNNIRCRFHYHIVIGVYRPVE